MLITTRSLPIVVSVPTTPESLLKDIAEAVHTLASELDEHDTGPMVLVCLEPPMELKNVVLQGMYVYTVHPDRGYQVNTVCLGHGKDGLESFPSNSGIGGLGLILDF